MWKLNGQGDKLFENPAVATWVAYVTKLDAKNADETMLSVLKTAYKDDTLALTKMLAAAKDNADTKAIADKLEEALYKDWRSSGKSTDDVFALLKLDDEMDDLLSDPVLNNWVTYVENLQQNPYPMLLAKLKSPKVENADSKLADMIVNAQGNSNTRTIAARLEKAELSSWSGAKMTADDVFKQLKLDETGDYLLASAGVSAWLKFVKENWENADDVVYAVLKRQFSSDRKVGEVLATGILLSPSKVYTVEVTNAVLNVWKSQGKSADDVFGFMMSNLTHGNILGTSNFNIWASYVKMVDDTNVFVSMVEILQKQYGKATLSNLITKAEFSKGSARIASRLKAAQELK
ncbi:putative secreted RxLR effector peptide protein [Phytophthora cinnamomi]|uniref:putative secreted RxLR effector peptide protein n=1 Tax=Phytophthora cinnamomi TaxID=4785 RepID=UPI00355A8A03|nr:putative secreted RxLR effector peptide protein [Phytophthora cinnamomi]